MTSRLTKGIDPAHAPKIVEGKSEKLPQPSAPDDPVLHQQARPIYPPLLVMRINSLIFVSAMKWTAGLAAPGGPWWSGELLMKFDQFRNFDLEHGFAAVVSAKDAELSL